MYNEIGWLFHPIFMLDKTFYLLYNENKNKIKKEIIMIDKVYFKKSEIADFINFGCGYPVAIKIIGQRKYKGEFTGTYKFSNGDLLKLNVVVSEDEVPDYIEFLEKKIKDVKEFMIGK